MKLDAIEVITLFVDDIDETRSFYQTVFTPEVIYEDAVSAVLKFSGVIVNLLKATEAPELVTPLAVAGPSSGSRILLTIKVDDADAVCAELRRRGVTLLNGPVDRPWGRRTAAFADPSGHVWEIAQELG
jgi:catechol 2,3-dioxygenase-like lactoylglutathione lyase family enzyme